MIERIETFGASYGENLPNGRFVASFASGQNITEAGSFVSPVDLIYTRIHPVDGFVGVGHVGDQALEFKDGSFIPRGLACGNSPVAYWPDGTLVICECVPPYGSQGIRWIDTTIHTGDSTIANPAEGIWQYTDMNGIKVGQGGDGIHGEDPLIIIEGGIRYLLESGTCRVVRFNYDPISATLAISCWKMNAASNVRFRLTIADILTLPRFPYQPVIDVPKINKPLWLGWYEINQPPPVMPPGNALLAIRYNDSGAIKNYAGTQFANYIDAGAVGTVEEIERKVKESSYPAVAYWDGRNWPKWPTLRDGDRLGLQAYCKKEESLPSFESSIRAIVSSVPVGYKKIALICQGYKQIPVNSLTDDLIGLVPIFARLARDYPRVDMLLVFSDQNRAGGMNDNPAIRPYWTKLFEGVTGTPPIETPMIEPVVTVLNWTLDELKNGREMRVRDTNNPAEGYEFRVHVRNGSMFAEIKNAKGNASTGLIRPVKECPIIIDPPDPSINDSTIQLNGRYFSRVNGDRMTLMGSSEFSLFKRYLDNDWPTFNPVISERKAVGFNILRIWLLNWSVVAFRNGVEQDMIHPNQYSDYYERLTKFVDFLGGEGFCVELTVFTSTQGLMPNPNDQQNHLNRTVAAVAGRRNVILELVNENDQHDNAVWEGLSRPSGVIISHGSNGADATGVRPTWDYEEYHTNGLNEWWRKTGHNAMEKADESNAPCWSNENERYSDNTRSRENAYDAMAGAALLCAGGCFHSQGGKFSKQFDSDELECAKEWVRGGLSVPLEYQPGQYLRRDDLLRPGLIRVYERRLSDGRGWIVEIRG